MQETRKRTSSIFFRVMSVFVLCIVPLLAVQMSMYLWGTDVVRDELYESANANAIYLKDQFDANVSNITHQIQYILKADDVAKFFVYHGNYTQSELYMQAKSTLNLLNTIRNSNPLIGEIRLYYLRLGMGLATGEELVTGEQSRFRFITLTGNELNARIELSKASTTPLIEMDGEFFVSATLPVALSSSETVPAYYIEVVLDSDEILKNLSAFSTSKKKYSLQYNHTTESFLFSDRNIASEALAQELTEVMRDIPGQDSGSVRVRLLSGDYTLVACYSEYLNITYGQLLSTVDLERIPTIFLNFIVIFALATAVSLVVLSLSIRRHVNRPTHKLLSAFGTTGEGRFDTRISSKNYAWEYQALIDRFNEMNQQIQELITTNYEHSINLQRAQLKQLQAQINPHFLYNSFFLLRQMVRSNDRAMCMNFCSCLGRYFQYITDNDNDTATLAEEYEHATNYLSIQQMRFEDVLEADIQPLPENLAGMEVLRLTLQPLFENIMTHSRWTDGNLRRIRFSIVEDGRNIHLVVEDNGEGVTDEHLAAVEGHLHLDVPVAETSGLDNIHRRLRLHYGEESGLSVGRSSLGGFSATITLPNGGRQHE